MLHHQILGPQNPPQYFQSGSLPALNYEYEYGNFVFASLLKGSQGWVSYHSFRDQGIVLNLSFECQNGGPCQVWEDNPKFNIDGVLLNLGRC